MSGQELMQAKIEAQQTLDTVEYGLRALKVLGTPRASYRAGVWGSQFVPEYEREALMAQVRAGMEAAGIVCWDNAVHFKLLQAKRAAREERDAAAVAVKAIGGVRQLRLALAA